MFECNLSKNILRNTSNVIDLHEHVSARNKVTIQGMSIEVSSLKF